MKYCIEFKIFFLKKNIKISKNINKMMTNTILLSSMLFSSTYLFSNSLRIINYNYSNNNSISLNMMNSLFLLFSYGIMINTLKEILIEIKS